MAKRMLYRGMMLGLILSSKMQSVHAMEDGTPPPSASEEKKIIDQSPIAEQPLSPLTTPVSPTIPPVPPVPNSGSNHESNNCNSFCALIHGKCDECTRFIDHVYNKFPVLTKLAFIGMCCFCVCQNETVQKMLNNAKKFTLKLIGIYDETDEYDDDDDDDDDAKRYLASIRSKISAKNTSST